MWAGGTLLRVRSMHITKAGRAYIEAQITELERYRTMILKDMNFARADDKSPHYQRDMSFLLSTLHNAEFNITKLKAGHNDIADAFSNCRCIYCVWRDTAQPWS